LRVERLDLPLKGIKFRLFFGTELPVSSFGRVQEFLLPLDHLLSFFFPVHFSVSSYLIFIDNELPFIICERSPSASFFPPNTIRWICGNADNGHFKRSPFLCHRRRSLKPAVCGCLVCHDLFPRVHHIAH